MREIKFRQAIFVNKKFSHFHYWGFLSSGHFASPETNSSTIDGAREHSDQFTGLHDKNGLTDIYEGDILDENGLIRGNVYESPQVFREGIDCVITGMGTSAWRGSESIAMGRGCKYSE
jgi:hypothetical protein